MNQVELNRADALAILQNYRNLELNERAYFKGIPVQFLTSVRTALKPVYPGVRVRFRGPRRDAMALTCLKSDAKTFAVYID